MRLVSAIFVIALALTIAHGQTIYGDMTLPTGAFLWLNAGAAHEALGGSATAAGGLKAAGNANPATLFEQRTLSTGASYSYMREKTFNSSIYAGKAYGNWAGAVRLFLMDSGEIEARSGPTADPDYTFTSHQLYTQFTAAKRFENVIDLGASAKWVHERIDQDTRDGWAFDLGLATNYRWVSAGIAVQNYGGDVVFKKYRERFPLTYRAGMAVDILDYGAISADFIKPDRMSGWFAVGAEANLTDYAVLRAGFTPGHDTRNFSAGFGFRKAGIELDYVLVNYSEGLGMSHQVTLSYNIVK
ncbi:MAG TPA: hypothetical protein ENN07_04515 [candidate division Zixibacteria bacterium]|nr:hypothetical protein [candidate division Zixibacteria bacterium]